MGGSFWSGSVRCILVLLVVLALALAGLVYAQGLQTSPYSNPSLLRGLSGTGGTNLAPSSPLHFPVVLQRRAPIPYPISSGMFQGILPPIPNLQFGYLYQFGNNVNAGRGTVDYLLPYSLNKNSVFFGEAHSEFQSFWNTLNSTFTNGTTTTTNSGFNNRVDVSLGGGARTILNKSTLLGMNGFYDTSRLGGTWYSSGGLGLQMAALVGGNDAIDLNFNWYGKLFNSNVFTNAFRYGPSNFDFQAGYSHELWNGGPDFRLSATGYQFDIGNRIYGWNAGTELKSRDGMFVLKYDVGNDKVNQTYQTVGAFVNVGFQLENVLKGESPFTKPTPIFKSPRNLWYMLTQPVNRDWHQPTTIVVNRVYQGQTGCTGGCCNLDRFLASVNMVGGPGGHLFLSSPFFVSFPAVPYACLDPSKHIVVEFDYVFTTAAPSVTTWTIAVYGTPITHFNSVIAPTPQLGHLTFTLNTLGFPAPDQSAFTTATTDPRALSITALTRIKESTLTITNVIIHFNQ